MEKNLPGWRQAEDECRCGHRRFEHVSDGCAVREMYGRPYSCECTQFVLASAAAWVATNSHSSDESTTDRS